MAKKGKETRQCRELGASEELGVPGVITPPLDLRIGEAHIGMYVGKCNIACLSCT